MNTRKVAFIAWARVGVRSDSDTWSVVRRWIPDVVT